MVNLKSLPSDPPAYEESAPFRLDHRTHESSSRVAYGKWKFACNEPTDDLREQAQSFKDSSPLITSISETKTEYFDLLPSFQLHQSILKRSDTEFDETALGVPPLYVPERLHESRSMPAQCLPVNDLHNIIRLDEGNTHELSYLFTRNEENDGYQYLNTTEALQRDSYSYLACERSRSTRHDTLSESVVDNIDRLPVAKYSPLSIQIFVTKRVPTPHEPNELENKLKEYSCCDIVNGYIIITNTAVHKVDFGLFTVSLEGTVTAPLHFFEGNNLEHPARNKIVSKKFLKMFDLNASYNYGVIPSSAGIHYEPNSRDSYDGCILGLPDDRTLKPGERYKKFITFRFPEMLLDNACPHEVMRHTMPPPSFGVDNIVILNGDITVNKALGYGTSSERGSPVRLRDLSEEVSVSYAIEAKFIDKQHSKQNYPIKTNANNPDPHSDLNYVVSKKAQFFVRFIPNVKSQIEAYIRAQEHLSPSQLNLFGIDTLLHRTLKQRSTWRIIEEMKRETKRELYHDNNTITYSRIEGQKQKNGVSCLCRPSYASPNSDQGAEDLWETKTVQTSTPVSLYARKRRMLFYTSHNIGTVRLMVNIPNKLVPYSSPHLFQKYNKGRDMWCDFNVSLERKQTPSSLIKPVTSNIEELYNRDDCNVLEKVRLKILFNTADISMKPPSLSKIDLNIVAWTYQTEYPLPLALEHDFFYTAPGQPATLQGDTSSIHANLLRLKQSVNDHIAYLRECGRLVSERTYSYLKGLSKLGVKKDTIKHFFQSITTAANTELMDPEWNLLNSLPEITEWITELDIPLKTENKGNYTLIPSFQNCLVGRLYALQILVKFKGADDGNNAMIDVPIIVG